jgi:hypothetical protein
MELRLGRKLGLMLAATGLTGTLMLSTGLAAAEPQLPGPPAPIDPMAMPGPPPEPFALPPGPIQVSVGDPLQPGPPAGPTPLGQNPAPYVGQPVFAPPTFNPINGSMVGVAKPIIINFQRPIADRPMAEQAVHISSNPPVPGKFYWMSDTQLRWRPIDFWRANTTVNIDASGTKSVLPNRRCARGNHRCQHPPD